jgi:hypothetical protein
LEQLDRALAATVPGRERAWTERVSGALGEVARMLRERAVELKGPDGMFAEIDLTRPTLARQASELYQEHMKFLKEAQALQAEVQSAEQAFRPHAGQTDPAGDLPEIRGAGAIPDFGALRHRIEQFVDGLKHQREGETELVLESVNTDIGVGD